MKSKRFLVKAALLFLVTILLPASIAEAFPVPGPYPVYVRPGLMVGDSDTESDFFADTLIPIYGTETTIIFLNPTVRYDDEDGNEQNYGGGIRYLYDEKVIIGLNGYYDTMRSTNNFEYEQWGVGLELLTKWVDARVNYYDPIGTKKNRLASLDHYTFESTSLLVSHGWEEALGGGDAEIGIMIPLTSRYFETRLFAGAYFYDSHLVADSDASGLRYRAEVRPTELINLTAEIRDDNVRGKDIFFGGYVELPFTVGNIFRLKNPLEGIGKIFAFGKGARPLRARMTEKVVRDRHINAPTYNKFDDDLFDAPLIKYADMIYVNADNAAAGVGTYENPYKTLASAEADGRYVDDIWVHILSTDATADTYTHNMTLPAGAVLWGEGYAFANLGGANTTPIIDGQAAATITLANNNEVMGLNITGDGSGTSYGITANNVTGINIHDNTIDGNNIGVTVLHTNADDIDATIVNNIFTNTTTRNIFLYSSDGSLTATVTGNTITGGTTAIEAAAYVTSDFTLVATNNTSTGNANGVTITHGSTGVGDYTVTDNTVTNSTTSSLFASHTGAGDSTFTFLRNTIAVNTGRGIDARFAGAGTATFNIESNTISDSTTTGMYARHTSATGTATFNILSNTVTGSGTDGISINKTGAGGGTYNLDGNTVSGSTLNGLNIFQNSGAATYTITSNTITGNTGDGLMSTLNGGTGDYSLSSNTITGNGDYGIYFDNGGGTYTIDLGGGTLASTGSNSIYGNTTLDLRNDSGIDNLKAENNWWGISSDPAALIGGANTTDYIPWLTTAP